MVSLIWTQLEANALLRQHGLADAGWKFAFDGAKRRGGQCRHADKTITMSRHLVPMWTEEQVQDTLIHELAHALVGPRHGHGYVWAAKMRELGARPERTHNNETVPGRYQAWCPVCSREVGRAHRFTAAMRQGRHIHPVCGNTRIEWIDTQMVGAR